jgi:hypothetical protein
MLQNYGHIKQDVTDVNCTKMTNTTPTKTIPTAMNTP